MSIDAFNKARFWSRVEVRKRHQCWPWRFGQNKDGYGEFRTDTVNNRAHRVAYIIEYGAIPEDAIVRHKCDNALCCNPEHLELGTHWDNVADRVERNRSARGEANGRAKLTSDDVIHIRQSHLSNLALATEYNVHEDTIKQIRKNETWTHL